MKLSTVTAKMDGFPEKVQTAFDPPSALQCEYKYKNLMQHKSYAKQIEIESKLKANMRAKHTSEPQFFS